MNVTVLVSFAVTFGVCVAGLLGASFITWLRARRVSRRDGNPSGTFLVTPGFSTHLRTLTGKTEVLRPTITIEFAPDGLHYWAGIAVPKLVGSVPRSEVIEVESVRQSPFPGAMIHVRLGGLNPHEYSMAMLRPLGLGVAGWARLLHFVNRCTQYGLLETEIERPRSTKPAI